MSLPPSEVPQGAIRFNTDSQRLEFYAQGEWWVMSTDTPNLGTSADTGAGARGMFVGGTDSDVIDYVNIASTGNATDFGNLTKARQESGGFSNTTRGIVAGDSVPASDNTIDFWTIPSTGNAQDFGDLSTSNHYSPSSGSSPTRAVNGGGGYPSTTDVIDYVQIMTTGNSVDFGNLTVARSLMMVGCFSNAHGGL